LIVAVTVNSLFLAEKGADVLVCWASSICTKYKSSLLPIVHWEYILLKVEQCTTHVTLTFREWLGFVGISHAVICYSLKVGVAAAAFSFVCSLLNSLYFRNYCDL